MGVFDDIDIFIGEYCKRQKDKKTYRKTFLTLEINDHCQGNKSYDSLSQAAKDIIREYAEYRQKI